MGIVNEQDYAVISLVNMFMFYPLLKNLKKMYWYVFHFNSFGRHRIRRILPQKDQVKAASRCQQKL